MSLIPRTPGRISVIAGFAAPVPLANPSSVVQIMTDQITNNQNSSAQQGAIWSAESIITKINIGSNGVSEWSSGTAQWQLWKNLVRTGTPVFNTGALERDDLPLSADGQVSRWYDVNISLTQDDFLTASWTPVVLAGGPEAIFMRLWGNTQ